ncbi:hypothetical protein [Streptomyces sp. BRA346]|uniref:hypothetical protein n=1 Tax=Streptomyces sp. BRA346 TaxID=2878199 RepID=UPI004063DCA6
MLGALLLTGPTCLGHALDAGHAHGQRVAHDSRQSPAAEIAETAGQPNADGPEGPEHCAPTPREKSGRAAQPSVRALPATATTTAVCRTVVLAVAPDRPHALSPRAPTVRSTLCSTSRWRL